MPNWFKVKQSFQEAIDSSKVGTRSEEFIKQRTVTATILLDAISFTDAEARAYEAADGIDINITNIDRAKYADVFRHETGNDWYECKVDFITEDEKTGKQKRSKSRMLINADDNKQANERLQLVLKTSLDPFEITDVVKTKIEEVVEYEADDS